MKYMQLARYKLSSLSMQSNLSLHCGTPPPDLQYAQTGFCPNWPVPEAERERWRVTLPWHIIPVWGGAWIRSALSPLTP